MIFWLLFLSLLSICKSDPYCCDWGSGWKCDTEECSCFSDFDDDFCYFTNGTDSDPNTCYIYATCTCCLETLGTDNNFCKDCSCNHFIGAAYMTDMKHYCYEYVPNDEIGCCNNDWDYKLSDNSYTCKSAPGLCNITTTENCWVMGPCSYEDCCLALDPSLSDPAASCTNYSGATNFTMNDTHGNPCWVFAPSISMVGGCGCGNVTGNCTCESSSLACNITFFDGSWGIIPPGSSALYTWYISSWYPTTETYYCPLNYDPPAILITIITLVVSGILTLFFLGRFYDPEFFKTTSIWKKLYRFGTILNMFWPAVHMSIALGYLFWLMDRQTFTPLEVPAPSGANTDASGEPQQYYILVNADWYGPNKNNATYIIPVNSTTVNGQDCYVTTQTEPTYLPGYPGIGVFLVVSLVHTFHSLFKPDAKMMNYFLYCISTAVNIFTVPWSWYAWDYCYSLLPTYSGSMSSVYQNLYLVDCGLILGIIMTWGTVLLGLPKICAILITGILVFGMTMIGFIYKILTYFQLALRFYPKIVVIFDLVFHIHFVSSACASYFMKRSKPKRLLVSESE